MIRINLLPEEYRKKARTPIKHMLAVLGVVVVNAGLGAYCAWTAIAVQAGLSSERSVMQIELDGLSPQVAYHKSLDAEKKQYETREQTLAQITKSRVSWTRKLDEFIDVVNRGGDGERHLVWLNDFQVSQATDPRTKRPGSVRANGLSGSEKFAQVANFLEDLETSPFITDFEPPAPPEGSSTLVDETLVPPMAWAFPLALNLKPAEERNGTGAAPAAPAKPKAAPAAGGNKP